jgi:hypothetical protein
LTAESPGEEDVERSRRAVDHSVESEVTAQKHGAENETPWWRTVPAMLTAAATFIGSVAALLALFVGPGGGGEGSNDEARDTRARMSTPTDTSSVPPTQTLAAEENVRKLLTLVPASVRSRCKQAPEDGLDNLARFSCDFGGATFYYELYAHELDALNSFRVSVSNEENYLSNGEATGHAGSCGQVRADRPFVGTWTRPGKSTPAGQQLCSYDFGTTTIVWIETGLPIVGSMFYSDSAQNREKSLEGAQLVWERVMSE